MKERLVTTVSTTAVVTVLTHLHVTNRLGIVTMGVIKDILTVAVPRVSL